MRYPDRTCDNRKCNKGNQRWPKKKADIYPVLDWNPVYLFQRIIQYDWYVYGGICCTSIYNWKIWVRRGGVADWTLDRTIRVWFPAYPHCVWALWWQRGKRRLRTSRCPCRGRLYALKTPSCPWRWVPGSRSKFRKRTSVPSLYSWNIAECGVKQQQTTQPTKDRMVWLHRKIKAQQRSESYFLHLIKASPE